MEHPEVNKYIQDSAASFVKDLYKLEYLEGQAAKDEFYNLVKNYDEMFIQKFSVLIDNTDLVDQIREMENPNYNRNEPLAKTSIIPDGRLNPNIAKLGNQTMGAGFRGGFSSVGFNSNRMSRTAYAKPPMDGPIPPNYHPNGSSMNQGNIPQASGFDVHANSKHYYPKDAEYLSNDFINKPGANFNTNKQAILIKQRQNNERVDPMLKKLRDNVTRANKNPQYNPMNQAGFGVPGFAGYNPTNTQPVSGHHNLLFNPQIGDNQYQRDENLQRNIQMLGGLESTLDFMGQSLTQNELRYAGRNSLNPMNNHTIQSSQNYNPYVSEQQQQNGFVGMGSNTNPNHLLRTQNISQRQLPQRRINYNDPYYKPPGSKIELARMMRAEREEKMMKQQKMQMKFEHFNKILRDGNPAPQDFSYPEYS